MACPHDGYRNIRTTYDRHNAILVFHWSCDGCGAILGEAGRQEYRPQFIQRPEPKRFAAPTLTA